MAGICVRMDSYFLAFMHLAELGFLEVCYYPFIVIQYYGKEGLALLYILARLHIHLGYIAIRRRSEYGIGQRKLSIVHISLTLANSCCCHADALGCCVTLRSGRG